MHEITSVQNHLLSMLASGIMYERDKAHETSSVQEKLERKRRAEVLKAALYRTGHWQPTISAIK